MDKVSGLMVETAQMLSRRRAARLEPGCTAKRRHDGAVCPAIGRIDFPPDDSL